MTSNISSFNTFCRSFYFKQDSGVVCSINRPR